jgi:nitronate monooxygenase
LRNSTFEAWRAAGGGPPGRRPGEGDVLGRTADGTPIVRYEVDTPRQGAQADIEAMCLYAGQGVGLVRDVRPAADIVRAMAAEAEAVLARIGRV